MNCLLGNLEESILKGRIKPVSTVTGFSAEIGASGAFCPSHLRLPVTTNFFSIQSDFSNIITSPYIAHIPLDRGYRIPATGTVQVALFNLHGSVIRIFLVPYNLSDMPPNSQTFIRQRTLFIPVNSPAEETQSSKWLRYLIHLKFVSSKSGRIYLHKEMKILILQKSDLEAAAFSSDEAFEVKSVVQMPFEPRYSPR